LLRGATIPLLIAFAVITSVIWTGMQYTQAVDDRRTARMVDGVYIEAGISEAQVNAMENTERGIGTLTTIVHPPDGAQFPATFPPPRIQWTDEYASRLYRVTIHAGDELLFTGVTAQRELTPPPQNWHDVRRASGPIRIQVTSGLVDLDGTVHGEVVDGEEASFHIVPDDESPKGMILFGAKHRPDNQKVGTISLLEMHLRIDAVDLERFEHRIVFRSSYGPDYTRTHPDRISEEGGPGPGGDEEGQDHQDHEGGPENNEGPGPDGEEGEGPGPDGEGQGGGTAEHWEITSTQCVSCHSISQAGEYIAVFSQTAEEAPPEFSAPNGFMTVLRMPEREVIIQLPHSFMPQFNPQNPNLIAFGQVDETIGVKDQMVVRKSDIHVLDLRTGKHHPVPGANEPNRVENLPYWSPDGKSLAFIRTKPNQMWHGSAGKLDIATVPYRDGSGGIARALQGASDNDKSNFLPVYSPDGRWIVFTQAHKGFFSQIASDLWIVPHDGGTARRMDCNSPLSESWHRFSPDGRWMAFVTNREDVRRPHIYLSRFHAETGTCEPAIQIPVVSGINAHTHAFSWTKRFDWLDDYDLSH